MHLIHAFFNSEIKKFLNTFFKFVLKGILFSLNFKNLSIIFPESSINKCFKNNFCSESIFPFLNKQLTEFSNSAKILLLSDNY